MWPVEKVLINLFCVFSFVLIYLSDLVLVRMNYTVIFSYFFSFLYLHFVLFIICCFYSSLYSSHFFL